MTAFGSLALAMLKGFLRDRTSVFFTVFFPLLFIVAFGVIFAGGSGTSKQKVIEVGDVPLIDTLPAQARADLDGVLTITRFGDLDSAVAQVRKGDAAAVVQQQGDRLVIHDSNADAVGSATVQGVFSSFVDQANIAVSGKPPTYALDTAPVEDQSLKAIQYIAPQMIAYGVSVGAVFGAALTLISWREKKVLRRLRLAPVPTAAVVGSRVAVSLVVAVFQLVLFTVISMLPFFGLQLRGAWYMAVPLVLAGTLSFLSLGLLVGAIAKTSEGGGGLANLVTLPMAFLSGAFIPVEQGPGWIAAVAKVLPMGYLITGMKDVMVRGMGPSAALLPIVILLAFAGVVTTIATRLFRWDAA